MTRRAVLLAAAFFCGAAATRAGMTISFGTENHDGGAGDTVFERKGGDLYLRNAGFVEDVGPGDEVAVKPVDVNQPVVTETTFDVTVGGERFTVKGIKVTNVQIKAQKALDKYKITAFNDVFFDRTIVAGGVMLDRNAVTYPNGSRHKAELTNTGFVNAIEVGKVTQSHDRNGAVLDLLPSPVTDGKKFKLGSGSPTLKIELGLTLEKDAILFLRDSGHVGAAAVPEPSLVVMGAAGLAGVAAVRRRFGRKATA